jgi:hypothetical protein
MKRFVITVIFAIVSVFSFQVNTFSQVRNTGLTGAWEAGPQNKQWYGSIQETFSVAVYNKQDSTFLVHMVDRGVEEAPVLKHMSPTSTLI